MIFEYTYEGSNCLYHFLLITPAIRSPLPSETIIFLAVSRRAAIIKELNFPLSRAHTRLFFRQHFVTIIQSIIQGIHVRGNFRRFTGISFYILL